uniref:Uncharacterized protein n=1 Tax=Panagrolaimus davidi TaxID=227884 RepID=A0A914QCQ4_9BILA
MPSGVQRCYIQHHSIVNNSENKDYNRSQESGTFAKSSYNISEYSCGDSYTWKPYSPTTSDDTNILNDQECAVKISLTTMHFFCCCYSNGEQCSAIGNLTGHGLTCPQLSMNSSLTIVNETSNKYEETENIEERINAENLLLQEQCHIRISVKRPKREPKLETSISLIKNDDKICEEMFKKIPPNQNCLHFERQCYTDIDDEMIYCCRFKYSGKLDASSSEDKILSIHSVYGNFVFDELKALFHP